MRYTVVRYDKVGPVIMGRTDDAAVAFSICLGTAMQDYTPFFLYPVSPTKAKSHAEHISLATLRYRIHTEVAKIENAEDLAGILDVIQQVISFKKAENEST